MLDSYYSVDKLFKIASFIILLFAFLKLNLKVDQIHFFSYDKV